MDDPPETSPPQTASTASALRGGLEPLGRHQVHHRSQQGGVDLENRSLVDATDPPSRTGVT